MAALVADNDEVLVDEIDLDDLAADVCSTCLVGIAELDGIWYHAATHGLAEHIARPSITLRNGART